MCSNYPVGLQFHGTFVDHHQHISVMELGHLLTRSGLTYLEVSSEVFHDSFCQLGNSVSLSWVVCPCIIDVIILMFIYFKILILSTHLEALNFSFLLLFKGGSYSRTKRLFALSCPTFHPSIRLSV